MRGSPDPITRQMRRAHRDSGLSHLEIAARAGVSENTVCRVMTGRNVTVANFIAVAEVIGVREVRLTITDRGDTAA